MTRRALAIACLAALAAVLATAGCTAQHTTDPNGRCLRWQMAVSVTVDRSSTAAKPSWDLAFEDTDTTPCVFGGVPSVRFLGSNEKADAGTVFREPSQDLAVPLGHGDVANATIVLDPTASKSCPPLLVRWLRVTAPNVAGGSFLIKAPAKFFGCASNASVASVGQVTAKRAK